MHGACMGRAWGRDEGWGAWGVCGPVGASGRASQIQPRRSCCGRSGHASARGARGRSPVAAPLTAETTAQPGPAWRAGSLIGENRGTRGRGRRWRRRCAWVGSWVGRQSSRRPKAACAQTSRVSGPPAQRAPAPPRGASTGAPLASAWRPAHACTTPACQAACLPAMQLEPRLVRPHTHPSCLRTDRCRPPPGLQGRCP
jgi:hypothetical protein